MKTNPMFFIKHLMENKKYGMSFFIRIIYLEISGNDFFFHLDVAQNESQYPKLVKTSLQERDEGIEGTPMV